MLFQGAHKLYVNRVVGAEQAPAEKQAQLQTFIKKAIQNFEDQVDQQAANIEPTLPGKGPLIKKGGFTLDIENLEDDQVTVTADDDKSEIAAKQVVEDKPLPIASSTFEVLGMVGLNKELFLFEKSVPMVQGVEKWLVHVERSMRETISKMMSYAVTSFPNQALDEWALDYPQQVILSVLHLILSHEINEVLEGFNLPPEEPTVETAKEVEIKD